MLGLILSTYLDYARILLLPKGPRTVGREEVSATLQEPGVETGYRPKHQPWIYYIQSVIHLHNETVNIWTHLVGCIMMTYVTIFYVNRYSLWEDEARKMMHVFHICVILYMATSALAHTLHSKSNFIHFICFQADYAAIGLNTFCSGFVAFYICSRHEMLFRVIEPYFMYMNAFLAWFSFLCSSYSKFHYPIQFASKRKLLQIGSVLLHMACTCFGVPSRLLHCYQDEDCSFVSIHHHIKWMLPLVTSSIFFASHIPEKFWPGKFDLVGQGHQIFHILSIAFSYYQQKAAEVDIDLLPMTFSRPLPNWQKLVFPLVSVIVLDALTMVLFTRYFKQKIQKQV